MKKILFLVALFVALISSCQNEGELLREETEENASGLELRGAAAGSSVYDRTTKIYRYHIYNGSTDADHYFGLEAPSGSSRIINGKTYQYETQEFNIFYNNYYGSAALALYRHYNSASNDHILSTSQNVTGYTYSGFLGYIFKEQQPGTIPLVEYYSSTRRDHFYVCNNNEMDNIYRNEKTYVRQGIIGYVYPGERIDPLKNSHWITVDYQNFGWKISTRLEVTYKEYGVTKYATYMDDENYWTNNKRRTYVLPDAAVLMDATFVYKGSGTSNFYFYDINTPNYNNESGVARLYIKKLDGYQTIYELKGK